MSAVAIERCIATSCPVAVHIHSLSPVALVPVCPGFNPSSVPCCLANNVKRRRKHGGVKRKTSWWKDLTKCARCHCWYARYLIWCFFVLLCLCCLFLFRYFGFATLLLSFFKGAFPSMLLLPNSVELRLLVGSENCSSSERTNFQLSHRHPVLIVEINLSIFAWCIRRCHSLDGIVLSYRFFIVPYRWIKNTEPFSTDE